MSSQRARSAQEAGPLTQLPRNAAEEAALFLCFALLPVDARLACAHVCSAWRALARRPELWASVSVSPSAGLALQPTAALVRAACECAPRGSLRVLDVSGCGQLLGSPAAHAALLRLLPAAGEALAVLRACGAPCGGFLTLTGCDELCAAAPSLRELHADVDVSTREDEGALLRALLRTSDAAHQCVRFASVRLRFAACLAGDALAAALAGVPELHLLDADLASDEGREAALALAAGAQRVHFSACRLPAAEAEGAVPLLLQLLRQPRLQALTLSGQAGARVFGVAHQETRALRALHAALGAPPHAAASPALTSLSLRGVGLFASPACAAALLGALARSASLQRLDLSGNPCNDCEAVGAALGALLAGANRAPSLTWLAVSACGLRDAGLRPLAAALARNARLRELRLQGNHITSAFLERELLPAVRANRTLRVLRVEAAAEAARRAEELVWRRGLAELDARTGGPAGAAAAAAAAAEHGYASYGMLRGLADFAPQAALGAGAYGEVRVAFDTCTGEHVALKQLRVTGGTNEGLKVAIVREAAILAKLDHPHVIASRGVVLCPRGGVRLALELAASGTLEDAMVAHAAAWRGTPLPGCEIMAAQLAAALAYCAGRGVLHRDLKPANVVLRCANASQPHLLLCDFGLARRAPQFPHAGRLSDAMAWTPTVVTITYRAPELLLGATRYGPPLDCWSLGCIVAEMALGANEPLFWAGSRAGDDAAAYLARVVEVCGTPTSQALRTLPGFRPFAHGPQRPCQLAQLLHGRPMAALAAQLLQLDPAARLTAKAALRDLRVPVAAKRTDGGGTRNMPTPYLCTAQLEALPARLDGVSEAADAKHRHELVGFIYDLAAKLGLPGHASGDGPGVPTALASAAATYAQRYFAQRSHVCDAERDGALFVGAAALLLACKALGGDAAVTCGAVARRAYKLRHKGMAPEAKEEGQYSCQIAAAEWRLAVALGFSFNVHTPEEEIATCALEEAETSDRQELYRQAHRLCRAAASTTLKLRFDATTLAACALALAARMLAHDPAQPGNGAPPALSLEGAARLLRIRHDPYLTRDLIAVDEALVAYWSRFPGHSTVDALARITRKSLAEAHADLAARTGGLSPHGTLYSANSPAWHTPPLY
jgi:serine/threonine protein kinase